MVGAMKELQMIKDQVAKCVAMANSRYCITMPNIVIKFDLTGKAAGQAVNQYGIFSVRFNMHMIKNHFDDVLNNTVPHEVAHIVCMYTGMGKNHDKVWKSVCIYLGGNGKRCHEMTTVAGRNTKKYRYVASCGTSLEVSSILHKRIQSGNIYRIKATQGKIDHTCLA